MWQNAHEDGAFEMAAPAAGNLVVFRRRYTIRRERIEIPGHIGIITNTNGRVDAIHANIKSGRVEEEPLESIGSVMGYMAINLLEIEEGAKL